MGLLSCIYKYSEKAGNGAFHRVPEAARKDGLTLSSPKHNTTAALEQPNMVFNSYVSRNHFSILNLPLFYHASQALLQHWL